MAGAEKVVVSVEAVARVVVLGATSPGTGGQEDSSEWVVATAVAEPTGAREAGKVELVAWAVTVVTVVGLLAMEATAVEGGGAVELVALVVVRAVTVRGATSEVDRR